METEENKKTTLRELLSDMPDEELIFIGAKTNWFFVGTVEEYRRHEKAVDRTLINYWEEKIAVEKDNLLSLCRNYIEDVVSRSHRHKDPERDSLNFAAWYKNYYTDIAQLNRFKPTAEREVENSYPRMQEGIGIVLDGMEVGKYWDREEFELFRGREKLEKYMEEEENEQTALHGRGQAQEIRCVREKRAD